MSVSGRGNAPVVVRLALVVVLLMAPAAAVDDPADQHVSHPHSAVLRLPDRPLDVLAEREGAALDIAVSRRYFTTSSTAVVAPADDRRAVELAARAGRRLGAPVLTDGHGVRDELDRLHTRAVLTIGDVEPVPGGVAVRADAAAVDAAAGRMLSAHGRPERPLGSSVVVTEDVKNNAAAVATARSGGAEVIELPDADPRRAPKAAEALNAAQKVPVVALGAAFRGDFTYTLAAVRRGGEQPGGGYLLWPGRHLVALYGSPGTKSLGVLGEQDLKASISRAKRRAATYDRLTREPVVPAFEIIATVASSGAGKDKDYSAESSVRRLRRWVDAARKAGLYVILDLQPGRSDFLSQAKRYRSLLLERNVGLALDPEWRLRRKQKPLRQIGSVSVTEINRTSAWLAELTREHDLPQKAFVLHEFSTRMIKDRRRLDTSHPELATAIHVDGHGTQKEKLATWRTLRKGAPHGVRWGWKNFYDEDDPMRSPSRTWALHPRPDLITYQ